MHISLLDPPANQASSYKLQHIKNQTIIAVIFIFIDYHALPIINYILLHPVTIKHKLQNYFYDHLERYFVSSNACMCSFLCPCSRCSQSPNVPNYDYL